MSRERATLHVTQDISVWPLLFLASLKYTIEIITIKIHYVAQVHGTICAVVGSTLNGCGGFATVYQPGHGPDLLSAQRLGSTCQI